jgi:hypothetical protein
MMNCCGQNVTVTVGCPACGYQTFLLPLNCNNRCPQLGNITCTVGPCQFNGTVQLSCNAAVIGLGSFSSVTVQWELNGSPVGSPVTLTAPAWVPTVLTHNSTGQTVNLSLTIVGSGNCPPIGMMLALPNCPACLPISISDFVGECNPDGTRPVTITAVLTGTPTTQITATMTDPCGMVTGSGTGSLTLTSSCALGPGTYTVTVAPAGCPPQTHTFTVKECCPAIAVSHTVGDCNSDGTRPVTVTAILTGGSSGTSINATMTGPCGPVSGSGAGSVTLTSSCNLNTGTYVVTVTAGSCPPQTYTFSIEDCCPKVAFNDVVKGVPICNAQHTRPVTISATVSPHNGVQTSATLTDTATGSVMATGSGSTPFVLTGSGNYTPGTHQVEVTFAAPLNCPPQYFQFCVPECETWQCFSTRKLILIALTTFITIACMLGIAALATYLDGVTGGAIWWALGRYLDLLTLSTTLSGIETAALVVAILLLIWWWLCIKFWGIQIGACCYACCILRIILWQVPLMVAVCLLWFLAASWLLNLICALILLLVSYLFFLWWNAKCCPGRCDALFYLATAVAVAFLAITAIEIAHVSANSVTAPNLVSAYIPWYIMVLWVVTVVLRLIILWVGIDFWVRWGLCLAKPD